jgi:acyl-lipid omega-6 desaturase (Delta-12 desaturase)
MKTRAPRPADLQHLRSSDGAGLVATSATVAVTMAGIGLSVQASLACWLVGQVLLAMAFLQWFVVLHECGHDTLFRTRRLHAIVGPIAGFFAAIPFANWKKVHGRHHRWTGWQDLDPTTAALVPRARGSFERAIVNVCWKFSIPLFAIVYRVENYWRLPRLFAMFPSKKDRQHLTRDTLALVCAYMAILVAVGPMALVALVGPAIVLSLVVEDVLLLSQHTHIPQHISNGEIVQPFTTIQQEAFTRSLRLPPWLSMLVLHFDAHELHHMYPFIPGYHLDRVAYSTQHEVGWWRWIRMAKRIPGDVLLFQNRGESGWEI